MHLVSPDGGVDERALSRALDLAEQSAAFASPNPTVGCVLSRDGEIFAEGAHRYDLRDHAEIVALKAATARGLDARGATAYVTLEPCSHHGRTGPCADALLAAGIRRCVVATLDPNPLVRGEGLAKLRAGGVQVELAQNNSAERQRARRLNEAFAFAVQSGRPFVSLKTALSADGRLAPPAPRRELGRPHWLTGPAARRRVAQLRHLADAVLTGIGTVLADDPQLTDRTGLPRRRPLLRVVLDRTLRLPSQAQIAAGGPADLLVVCEERANPEAIERLRSASVEVLPLPASDGGDFLRQVLAELATRQIRSVLLEAGPGLNGAFLQANLVDRAVLFFAEAELGPEAMPFSSDGTSPFALTARLQAAQRTTYAHGQGEDVCVEGLLHDPWAGVP